MRVRFSEKKVDEDIKDNKDNKDKEEQEEQEEDNDNNIDNKEYKEDNDEENNNKEETGKEEGECFKFERDCSKSLFKTSKYSEEANRRPEKGTSEMSKVTLEQLVASHTPVDNEVM